MKVFYVLLCFFTLTACSNNDNTEKKSTEASSKPQTILIATTTSVNDTGLMDFLSERIKKERNITMKWVSVGTGKALALGKNCDADMLIVHAPTAEKKAIQDGYITERIPFMENSFVIVGPKTYMEQYKNVSVETILHDIYASGTTKTLFVSRGDDSGTHKKEREIWKKFSIAPNAKDTLWYLESGQGMMQTLTIANEKNAFTLTDMATWLRFSEKFPKTNLAILTKDSAELLNTYSILLLSTKQCPNIKDTTAREVATWLLQKQTQQAIASYSIFGTMLFTPLYPEEMPK